MKANSTGTKYTPTRALRSVAIRMGQPDHNGCRIWLGSKNSSGYGTISTKSLPENLAHRLVWHIKKGAIPDGAYIDHLCRNRDCVEVSHLEVVTFKENILRGIGPTAENARKTHCIHGHEFTPENTMYVTKEGGGRKCRTCHNELHKKKSRRKSKEKNTAKELIEGLRNQEKFYLDWCDEQEGNLYHRGHAEGIDHAIQQICRAFKIPYTDTTP